jgi:hypothetical protein
MFAHATRQSQRSVHLPAIPVIPEAAQRLSGTQEHIDSETHETWVFTGSGLALARAPE